MDPLYRLHALCSMLIVVGLALSACIADWTMTPSTPKIGQVCRQDAFPSHPITVTSGMTDVSLHCNIGAQGVMWLCIAMTRHCLMALSFVHRPWLTSAKRSLTICSAQHSTVQHVIVDNYQFYTCQCTLIRL